MGAGPGLSAQWLPRLAGAPRISATHSRHGRAGARLIGFGQVEVLDRRGERAPVESSPPPRRTRPEAAGSIWSIAAKMRRQLGHAAADLAPACRRAGASQAARRARAGSSSPPCASPAGTRRAGPLHPALGVDVDAVLLGVGGARQDHVGRVRAAVAVVALVDDEGVGRARPVSISSAPSRNRTSIAPLAAPASMPATSRPPVAGHEAEVEAADARGRGVQDVEAVPAVADHAEALGELRGGGQHGGPVGAASAPCPGSASAVFAACSTSAKLCRRRAGRRGSAAGAEVLTG